MYVLILILGMVFLFFQYLGMSNVIKEMERTIERLQSRIRHLEQFIQPNTTDSPVEPDLEDGLQNKGMIQQTTIQPTTTQHESLDTQAVNNLASVNEPSDNKPAEQTPIIEPATHPTPVSTQSIGSEISPPEQASRPDPKTKPIKSFALFSQENLMLRIGVVLMFLGVSFLLKLTIGYIPLSVRIIAVLIFAALIVIAGYRLQPKRREYGLIIQGAGIGLFYMTLFVTFTQFNLISQTVAFIGLVLTISAGIGLSLKQDALILAVLSTVGGFLTPILVSTGAGNHVVLFSYYLLLNGVVLSIAWFKTWRPLNIIGFGFSFGVMLMWAVLRYKAGWMISAACFATSFLCIYIAVSLLFVIKQSVLEQSKTHNAFVDGTITFGSPAMFFSIMSIVVWNMENGAAWVSTGLSGLYTALWLSSRRMGAHYARLKSAFGAIALVSATIAVPLFFSSVLTMSIWALESCAIIWLACRQNQKFALYFGALLQTIAQWILFIHYLNGVMDVGWINYVLVGCSGIASGYFLKPFTQSFLGNVLSTGFLWAGSASWLIAFIPLADFLGLSYNGMFNSSTNDYLYAFLTIVTAVSLSGFYHLGHHLRWQACYRLFNLLPLIYIGYGFHALAISIGDQPFAHAGWLAWPMLFAMHMNKLYCDDQRAEPSLNSTYHHTALLWSVLFVSTLELRYWTYDIGPNALAISSILPAIALLQLSMKAKVWPWLEHRSVYLTQGVLPIIALLTVWFIDVGIDSPFLAESYIPILNPLDITLLLVIWTTHCWLAHHSPTNLQRVSSRITGIIGFVAFNAILMRTIHHWAGIPYYFDALWDSQLVQTALSISWALIAVTAMLISTKRHDRHLWINAALLIGAVTVKLFLVDLSNSNGIERTVSFIGVGLLLMGVNYVAPIPRATHAQDDTSA